jgi:ParB family transcriptional regulator, chromosome partitioning protein
MSTMEVTAAPVNRNTDRILVEDIPLDQIRPSKANPRRRMDLAALAELASNIRVRGVLQPILVRPFNGAGYEIVCGQRRWQASKEAGRETIPARIMNLSDAEALELAVIENVQREGVHELDEAMGYKALIQQNPDLYTVETIAAKVGRSPKYVYGRLKLAELTLNLQKAFYDGKLTAGHAMEIARLQPRDQELALSECFPGHRTTAAILKDKDPRPINVRELRDWIQREIHLSLAQAPFDVNDPNLLPAAGPCTTCPKRSGSNPLLFADAIKRPDVCTDRECFRKKKDTLVELRLKEVQQSGEKPVKVSDSHLYYGQKALAGVIYRPDYHDAQAGDCPDTVAAVVVEGNRAGTKLHICTNPKCKTHAVHSVGLCPEEKAQRQKQAAELRIQQEFRKRLLQEVYKRVPGELSRHELGLVALRYFEQSGHDSQHRIFKFFAWEVAKAKAPNGGYVDYPKLVSTKLKTMTTAEIGRFLMVCALASDLYFPSCLSGATLPKDSTLAKEAAHYKINADKVLRQIRESSPKKSSKEKNHSKPQLSATPKR